MSNLRLFTHDTSALQLLALVYTYFLPRYNNDPHRSFPRQSDAHLILLLVLQSIGSSANESSNGNGGANSHILMSGNVKYTKFLFLVKLMHINSNEHLNTRG